MSFSKPQVGFSLNFAWHFIVIKDNSSVLVQVKHNILCTKETNQSAHFWNFWALGSKFTKFLSFLIQQINFSSNLRYSSVSWDITPLHFFSWNFIYFPLKEPIKSTNLVKWKVWNLALWWAPFVKNNMKLQLIKNRRVISHDSEEWCKV